MSAGACTLDALAAQAAQGTAAHSTAVLLLGLQSSIGELAEVFQWKAGPPQSIPNWGEADRGLVSASIGRAVVLLARLAAACDVDLGAAVQHQLQPGARASWAAQRAGAPPPPVQQPQRTPLQRASPQSPTGLRQPLHTPLQERQGTGTFGRFSSGSTLQEHALPAAARRARGAGDAAPAAAPAQPAAPPACNGGSSHRPTFKRSLTVNTVQFGGAHGANPSALYSPTHFSHDLFSPACDAKQLEIEYNSGRPALPLSLSKQKLRDAQQQLRLQESSPRAPDSPPLSPRTLSATFFPMLEALRTSTFTAEEFDALDLTFCVPDAQGRMVDLIPNGRDVRVTLETCAEYVRLATEWRDKQERRGPDTNPHSHSSPSSRPPIPSPPPPEPGTSPHLHIATTGSGLGSGGTPAHGHIDPKSPGRWLTPVHSTSTFNPARRRTSLASFGCGGSGEDDDDDDDEGEYRGLDLLCEVCNERLREREAAEAAAAASPAADRTTSSHDSVSPLGNREDGADSDYMPMVEQLEQMLLSGVLTTSDLEDMGLTFCIPYGPEGELVDLIPDGRHVTVTLDKVSEFIRLAREKHGQLTGGS
eukprot:TRINITY_DN1789_c0_g1_i1.p1 TRINITY_DN1789_c0_g1~~TRINITY_DN1789_c0_g1_i1.p1  ORF type:complete len:614 (+),score=150.77 TRINITY_DN1789_c0_g1_i1:78-1844(+)